MRWQRYKKPLFGLCLNCGILRRKAIQLFQFYRKFHRLISKQICYWKLLRIFAKIFNREELFYLHWNWGFYTKCRKYGFVKAFAPSLKWPLHLRWFLGWWGKLPSYYPNMKSLWSSFDINGKADIVLVWFAFGGFYPITPDGTIAVFTWLKAIEMFIEFCK